MISPEKNDVDINRLFHWGKKVEIFDRFGNKITDAYIRLVGDADVNKARVFAIRKAAELRKQLKTDGSDERVAFISSIFEMDGTAEDLVDIIVNLNLRRLSTEAVKEVKVPFPKEPKSDDDLEKFEKFQQEVDSYEERRNLEVTRVVLEKAEQYKISIANMHLDDLKKLYERLMIDTLCEQKMMNAFRDICTFYGTFSDEEFKSRAFNSFDEFDNLPTEIKDQYQNGYDSLEINLDQLKKSLEAMR